MYGYSSSFERTQQIDGWGAVVYLSSDVQLSSTKEGEGWWSVSVSNLIMYV